jgi:hypothetical protein
MKQKIYLTLMKGDLDDSFQEAKKAYTMINGGAPARYSVPLFLYDILCLLLDTKPLWDGKPLDPWDKEDIRGQ